MHCMIAWGVRPDQQALSEEDHEQLEAGLSGHSWTRVFPGLYVVGLLYGEREREEVVDQIRAKLEEGLSHVMLLVSPAIERDTGLYNGALPYELWDEINERSLTVPEESTGSGSDEEVVDGADRASRTA